MKSLKEYSWLVSFVLIFLGLEAVILLNPDLWDDIKWQAGRFADFMQNTTRWTRPAG